MFNVTCTPLHCISVTLQCKIEKVPRGIRGEESSKDMASSRNLVSTIGALASYIILQENGPVIFNTGRFYYLEILKIDCLELHLDSVPSSCNQLDVQLFTPGN